MLIHRSISGTSFSPAAVNIGLPSCSPSSRPTSVPCDLAELSGMMVRIASASQHLVLRTRCHGIRQTVAHASMATRLPHCFAHVPLCPLLSSRRRGFLQFRIIPQQSRRIRIILRPSSLRAPSAIGNSMFYGEVHGSPVNAALAAGSDFFNLFANADMAVSPRSTLIYRSPESFMLASQSSFAFSST